MMVTEKEVRIRSVLKFLARRFSNDSENMRRQMKTKLYKILTILMIVMIGTSPVFARGAISLSSNSTPVDFTLGSLIANGTGTGLGNTDWEVVLNGVGHAGVICTNNGENDVPGQSFPHVVGSGVQLLDGESTLRKNGKELYVVTAKSEYEGEDAKILTWYEGGCPNSNWTARIEFVYWDFATLYAFDPANYDPDNIDYSLAEARYEFQCVTTYTGPRGDPDSTFDDGTVSCIQTYPTKGK
jgi:hypothetical protein